MCYTLNDPRYRMLIFSALFCLFVRYFGVHTRCVEFAVKRGRVTIGTNY